MCTESTVAYCNLPQKQSGSRKLCSTATTLIDVVDNILVARDVEVDVGNLLVFLVFSRVFDTINTTLHLSFAFLWFP